VFAAPPASGLDTLVIYNHRLVEEIEDYDEAEDGAGTGSRPTGHKYIYYVMISLPQIYTGKLYIIYL